jgi:hypothetical protein
MSVAVQAVPAPLHYFTPPIDGTKPFLYIDADPTTGLRKQNWEHSIITKNIENIRESEGVNAIVFRSWFPELNEGDL